eukprot:TRINITY_DN17202_c0_g1_i1.p1 TRINITY_DN17202_c0_g1~~TRINITY_DN17202_c0_g1_i1.p1  ORF type:complete len:343 (+),score=56.99 TRINITY_DN17202_c0_g1_i1:60-1031(+)
MCIRDRLEASLYFYDYLDEANIPSLQAFRREVNITFQQYLELIYVTTSSFWPDTPTSKFREFNLAFTNKERTFDWSHLVKCIENINSRHKPFKAFIDERRDFLLEKAGGGTLPRPLLTTPWFAQLMLEEFDVPIRNIAGIYISHMKAAFSTDSDQYLGVHLIFCTVSIIETWLFMCRKYHDNMKSIIPKEMTVAKSCYKQFTSTPMMETLLKETKKTLEPLRLSRNMDSRNIQFLDKMLIILENEKMELTKLVYEFKLAEENSSELDRSRSTVNNTSRRIESRESEFGVSAPRSVEQGFRRMVDIPTTTSQFFRNSDAQQKQI